MIKKTVVFFLAACLCSSFPIAAEETSSDTEKNPLQEAAPVLNEQQFQSEPETPETPSHNEQAADPAECKKEEDTIAEEHGTICVKERLLLSSGTSQAKMNISMHVSGGSGNPKAFIGPEGANFEDVVFAIRKKGIHVVMDHEAIQQGIRNGTVKSTVTLRAENMTVRNALNWITLITGLAWTIRDEAVFISTPDKIRQEPPLMIVYDARDLHVEVPDFPAPAIGFGRSD